jgi:hypothetical protein
MDAQNRDEAGDVTVDLLSQAKPRTVSIINKPDDNDTTKNGNPSPGTNDDPLPEGELCTRLGH